MLYGADLVAVPGIRQHVDQIAVVGGVDVQPEEKERSEENSNRGLRWPKVTILPGGDCQSNQRRPNVIFSIFTLVASKAEEKK